ncbi:hypothetical protein P154DRAFT_526775 [Amniculicola lignicola CBS 123094]|uniref:Chromo domain-containing protein n=1 Tax=Amniculicola lignicola CBS 123094 TaxID=1392246 RepID=A0A6A5W434_9PLEO|nr:hypothetical protein P154DRAFT_526775 [Amniculicola lignicola CBS 123094]
MARPSSRHRKRQAASDAEDRAGTRAKRRRQKPVYKDHDSTDKEDEAATQAGAGGELWAAKQILQEKASQYLIEWEGVDDSGSPWAPSWEKKSHANRALVHEWEERSRATRTTRPRKAAVIDKRESIPAGNGGQRQQQHSSGSPSPPPPRRPPPLPSPPPPPPPPRLLPQFHTAAVPDPAADPPAAPLTAAVLVTLPPNFNAAEYDRFTPTQSYIPSTPSTQQIPQLLSSTAESEIHQAASTPAATQAQSTAQELPERSHFVTPGSGEPESPPSPSISIPETEPELLSDPIETTSQPGPQREEADVAHSGPSQPTPSQPTHGDSISTNTTTTVDLATEQHAQIVPPDSYHSTQGQSVGSIRPTVEIDTSVEHHKDIATPLSRHDSSQESPIHSQSSLGSSPVARPPPQSLGAIDSLPPPPPHIPTSSNMSMDEFEEGLRKMIEAGKSTPIKPRTRILQALSPATPGAAAASGTRSPSTIPDHAVPRPISTSLRATAHLNNASELEQPVAPVDDAAVPVIEPVPFVTTQVDSNSEAGSADSLLNDEPELLPEEHIVPIVMEGRQRDMYVHELNRKDQVLNRFLEAPQDFSSVGEIEGILQTLKAVELHPDVINSEASSQEVGAQTQAQWDIESAVKFRFLFTLLSELKDQNMHLVLVLREDNDKLFEILEKTCQGRHVNYKIPQKGRAANPADGYGSLLLTIVTRDSGALIQPPTAIVSLDGADAAEIRKKHWSNHPSSTVPLFQLVVPRTVGHIEKYVSSALGPKKRLHTIFATMSQMRAEIGRPINVGTPRSLDAGIAVAQFLIQLQETRANGLPHPEWEIPPIGNIKDVIEYQSQQSPDSVSSPARGSSIKRPLDDDEADADPAKRMRMTPQPRASHFDVEVTHVSDSMPGTATEVSQLQKQLVQRDRDYRQLETAFDQRQNEFEDLRKQHAHTLADCEKSKKSAEQAMRLRDNAQERYAVKCTEVATLRTQLGDQQKLNLASEDEKIAKIAELEAQLQAKTEEAAREKTRANSANETQEYLKDQYAKAQERAIELQTAQDALTSEMQVLRHQASGEVLALKQSFDSRREKEALKQASLLRIENERLKQLLAFKDEEVSKLRAGRGVGVGTRAASVPRSPRVGGPAAQSRATSPVVGNRVSNLRNGR